MHKWFARKLTLANVSRKSSLFAYGALILPLGWLVGFVLYFVGKERFNRLNGLQAGLLGIVAQTAGYFAYLANPLLGAVVAVLALVAWAACIYNAYLKQEFFLPAVRDLVKAIS